MVAQTLELPNLRKLFIPDPGYVLLDCDEQRADAQVVAWEAGDEILKQIFREGLDLHHENAKMWFNVKYPTYAHRQKAKKGIHAIHYIITARTLAKKLALTTKEAQALINRWFDIHPLIREWHEFLEACLQDNRTVYNKFGYQCYFFERLTQCLKKAAGWVPQSTVALSINQGLIQVEDNIPEAQILLQVHDSGVLQVPKSLCPSIISRIQHHMHVEIPYDDPLTIPITVAASDKSWGDVKDWDLCKKIWQADNDNTLSYNWAEEELKLSKDQVNEIIRSRTWYEETA